MPAVAKYFVQENEFSSRNHLSQKMSSTSTKVYFLLFFCGLIATSKANKSFGEHFAHGLSVIKQIQNRKGLSPVELRYDTIFFRIEARIR